MNRRTMVATLIASFMFSLLTLTAGAYSDLTGVYARVDKVVFEPNETAPERIQIWGAFALATRDNRYNYDEAQRGYLYYSLTPGKEEVCRKEWADLKAVAGTGEIVAVGGRAQPARLRKAKDKPTDPDVYPVDHGLTKVEDRRSNYSPIHNLRLLPKEN
jgi:hypothetical protein